MTLMAGIATGMASENSRILFSEGSNLQGWWFGNFYGQISLTFIRGKQNSTKYRKTLELHLLPFGQALDNSQQQASDNSDGLEIFIAKPPRPFYVESKILENTRTRATFVWWPLRGALSGYFSMTMLHTKTQLIQSSGFKRKLLKF